MKRLRREYNSANLERARGLRREMTPAEKRLWFDGLRASKTGFAFRRQHPFGPYVLDFYCAAAQLCVELDGHSHVERKLEDRRRDEALANAGIRTMRFGNSRVFDDLISVLREIGAACGEPCAPQRSPESAPVSKQLEGTPSPIRMLPAPPRTPRLAAERGEAAG